MAEIVSTYSIAACDLEAGQWGVAVQSKFLSVGAVVPWAEPQVGAVATQAYANPRYGPQGLEKLREGKSAQEVVDELTQADDGRSQRQLGIVDAQGGSASFTGDECLDWAGGRTGDGYAAQGNILVSAETVDALAETFEGSAGKPLSERLLDCLDAAQAAGGDSRGQQSASLLVVERDGGYAGLSDLLMDLRVDDHERPIEELRRIYGLHQEIYVATPREKAGDRVVEEHREAQNGHEELYFVVSGRATFTLEDEEHDVPAGTFVFCRPGTKRGAIAAEDGTTVFAMGARAGMPHEISGWEGIFVAFGYLRNGDEERGREAIEAAIAERPNEWQGYFNAACFESLTGHKDAAIAHLNRAIELNPEAREAARQDEDFDPIRDDPEFPA